MKAIRYGFSALVCLLLLIGYAASQYFAFSGRNGEWMRLIDGEPVVWLALVVLLASVGLGIFFREEGDSES